MLVSYTDHTRGTLAEKQIRPRVHANAGVNGCVSVCVRAGMYVCVMYVSVCMKCGIDVYITMSRDCTAHVRHRDVGWVM